MSSAAGRQAGKAHVVVFGNEKGGSGKSTTAMHVTVALMQAGLRVASIDLDSRQQSFTRYVENRKAWAAKTGAALDIPHHFAVPKAEGRDIAAMETREFSAFAEALSIVEPTADVIVIDTPGHDSYLMRLAHSLADTLVTPMNDSFIDFDVLGRVDPVTLEVIQESHYAAMVREARSRRAVVEGGASDWVLVRNRITPMGNRNAENIATGLANLARTVGFRLVDGITERTCYREFFPKGLTALDPLEEATLGGRPTMAHLGARQEVRGLIAALGLPWFDASGMTKALDRVTEAARDLSGDVEAPVETPPAAPALAVLRNATPEPASDRPKLTAVPPAPAPTTDPEPTPPPRKGWRPWLAFVRK